MERQNMKLCRIAPWVIFLGLFSSCSFEVEDKDLILSMNFDFNESDHGWKHGFAEYPAGPDDSALYELKYAYTDQPAGSLLTKRSIMLSGKNLNQDLFMFLKKKITGLKPDTDYTITFNVDLSSQCSGANATAGSVYLKAGAMGREPVRVNQSGYYVMNIDKGDQDVEGQEVVSLGNIVPASNTTYSLITLNNNSLTNSRYISRTNADGELWLIIGTDSNLEGTASFFYNRINVAFSAF
ncbi:MAG TPA: hypothetical protein VFO54_06020 [Chryseosolibacter sp.]|nr:hypothetical protein [Chryseosolibacter sp.]